IVTLSACAKSSSKAQTSHQSDTGLTTFQVDCVVSTTVLGKPRTWTVLGTATGALQEDGTYIVLDGQLSIMEPVGLPPLPDLMLTNGTYDPNSQKATCGANQGMFSPTITYDGVAGTAQVTAGPFGNATLDTYCTISAIDDDPSGTSGDGPGDNGGGDGIEPAV